MRTVTVQWSAEYITQIATAAVQTANPASAYWSLAAFALDAQRQLAALQEYAYHVEGCRECGEMSWTSCSDGKRLRLAAFPEETRAALGEDRP